MNIRTNGAKRTPEYNTWKHMRGRCNNPSNHKWPSYGGRGIRVCCRWDSFEIFFADMGKKPEWASSIERIDNNGNYEPGNCKWGTSKQQANNRRSSHYIQFHGERKTLQQWSEITGIASPTIRIRLKRGWSTERALTTK